jgi:2-polyprenyl-6-methoxyphenol hydroxylase-like FAD-dependent oxidoreductase
LALRLTAAEHPRIEIRCPALITGLLHRGDASGLQIVGVQVDDEIDERADVVIDAGGRRSPMGPWLKDLGVDVREDVQDCGITYHTRYYRQSSTSTMSRIVLPGVRGELEGVLVLGFIGDHGTYGLMIAAPPWDEELKVLRHDWAFDAALAEIPTAAPWAAPENGIPLHSVATMAGHQNVLRHWVSDGEPVVLGVLPVGDSLCTTNPAYGWGASMSLTYAFAAVEAICEGGDQRTVALRYHDAVRNEADGVYRESAAMDRTRTYRWNMEPVPEHDADEAERQSLIAEGIMRGALRDPVLGRAFLRRMNLLDAPHEILDDPEVAQHARDMREYYASRPPRKTGPDRAELLAAIERARPPTTRDRLPVTDG